MLGVGGTNFIPFPFFLFPAQDHDHPRTVAFVWGSESKKLPAAEACWFFQLPAACWRLYGRCAPSSDPSKDHMQQGGGFFLLWWGWRVGWGWVGCQGFHAALMQSVLVEFSLSVPSPFLPPPSFTSPESQPCQILSLLKL